MNDIQVLQKIQTIRIDNQSSINVLNEIEQITIARIEQPIVVKQPEIFTINITGQIAMAQIIPFSFTASTDGQALFGPLPAVPAVVICLFIQGTGQDQLVGDFTISGLNILLLGSGPVIFAGDKVFGAIQI